MEVTTISRIGLAGLAVMSQNLALDIAEKGFLVSVYNNTKPLDRQHKVLGVVETLERQLSFLLCALNCLDWEAYLNPKMRYCGFGCWEFTVVGRHCGWLFVCLQILISYNWINVLVGIWSLLSNVEAHCSWTVHIHYFFLGGSFLYIFEPMWLSWWRHCWSFNVGL